MPVASIMKEVSNRWAAMSKSEKDPYINEAREDKRRYESELSEIKSKPGFKNIIIEEESKHFSYFHKNEIYCA